MFSRLGSPDSVFVVFFVLLVLVVAQFANI